MRIDSMRAAIPAAAAILALAAPAFGQGAGQPPGQQPPGQQTQQQQIQQQQAVRTAPLTQEKLRQQMTQAGFQDVRILDAAYLVQARTAEGDTVLMMINPPAGFAGGAAGSPMEEGGDIEAESALPEERPE